MAEVPPEQTPASESTGTGRINDAPPSTTSTTVAATSAMPSATGSAEAPPPNDIPTATAALTPPPGGAPTETPSEATSGSQTASGPTSDVPSDGFIDEPTAVDEVSTPCSSDGDCIEDSCHVNMRCSGGYCLYDYPDDDGDGESPCIALDCDDSDPLVNGRALERCDGRDNNCDDRVDFDIFEDFDPCNVTLPGAALSLALSGAACLDRSQSEALPDDPGLAVVNAESLDDALAVLPLVVDGVQTAEVSCSGSATEGLSIDVRFRGSQFTLHSAESSSADLEYVAERVSLRATNCPIAVRDTNTGGLVITFECELNSPLVERESRCQGVGTLYVVNCSSTDSVENPSPLSP